MRLALLAGLLLAACKEQPPPPARSPRTTSGAIAVQNLDYQIARTQAQGDSARASLVDLLLMKAQFLGPDALDLAVSVAETHGTDPLARARVYGAVHRFSEALAQLDLAQAAGATVAVQRATVFVAMNRLDEALPLLEAEAGRAPTYAALAALGSAHLAASRFDDAERAFDRAEHELRTTSPFPFAWLYLQRGLVASEQTNNPAPAERWYRKALEVLPQYHAAAIHLAQLEAHRGEVVGAIARLEPMDDPEALALLAELRPSSDAKAKAVASYERLLAKHPLAFAQQAAAFYLEVGGDPQRALYWAEINAANRGAPLQIFIRKPGNKEKDRMEPDQISF